MVAELEDGRIAVISFQLHVTDSESRVGSQWGRAQRLLSTPCNGFKVFRLYVWGSRYSLFTFNSM